MSIDTHDHQHDVVSRIPVCGYDITRYGSDNRTNAFSSPNSVVLIQSSVRSSSPSFHHSSLAVTVISGCDLSYMLPNFPFSFPFAETHRSHSVQVARSTSLYCPFSSVSCVSNLPQSTSGVSEPCRSIQLKVE